MKTQITQTKQWQKLQDDLGAKSFFEKTDDYQYLAIEKKTPVGNYLFLPYGPSAKDEAGFQKAILSLENLAKEQGSIFIRLEPIEPTYTKLLPPLARKVRDVEPAETWVLDLPKISEEDPLDNSELRNLLPSRLLRYYKNREKQGITIIKSHDPADIRHLVKLQSEMAKEKGITTFTEDYLKAELSQDFATLYLLFRQSTDLEGKCSSSSIENQVLAAGLVFDDEKTRYNLQGAQSDEGRRLHATGILTIELIKDAAKAGKRTFDFWGIAPDGAPSSHPWAGFTAFKKTFAGREVKYAGTYDLPVRSLKYHLYRLLRRFKH
ncbi:peptidoglycan bridge formation glycyltransferase FemA/FemB family protein [Candidatus Saccharibacteria bacterium]|nr:peptidoglycan bridge formation glycyltransferase FemA/FemB family protein [Candidatus Saccharibacteria bacterium]